MRSEADFPQLTTEMKIAFQKIYGIQRGKFEEPLRSCKTNPPLTGVIPTEIPNLTLHISREW